MEWHHSQGDYAPLFHAGSIVWTRRTEEEIKDVDKSELHTRLESWKARWDWPNITLLDVFNLQPGQVIKTVEKWW